MRFNNTVAVLPASLDLVLLAGESDAELKGIVRDHRRYEKEVNMANEESTKRISKLSSRNQENETKIQQLLQVVKVLQDRSHQNNKSIEDETKVIEDRNSHFLLSEIKANTAQRIVEGEIPIFQHMHPERVLQHARLSTDQDWKRISGGALEKRLKGLNRLYFHLNDSIPGNRGNPIPCRRKILVSGNSGRKNESLKTYKPFIQQIVGYTPTNPLAFTSKSGGAVFSNPTNPLSAPNVTSEGNGSKRKAQSVTMNLFKVQKIVEGLDPPTVEAIKEALKYGMVQKNLKPALAGIDNIYEFLGILADLAPERQQEILLGGASETPLEDDASGTPPTKKRRTMGSVDIPAEVEGRATTG